MGRWNGCGMWQSLQGLIAWHELSHRSDHAGLARLSIAPAVLLREHLTVAVRGRAVWQCGWPAAD